MERLLVLLVSLGLSLASIAQVPIREADSLLKTHAVFLRILDPKNVLSQQYQVDLFGVSIYADAAHKAKNEPEYRVSWQELETFRRVLHFASREEAMAIMQAKKGDAFSPEIQKTYGRMEYHAKYIPTAKEPLKGIRIALDPGHMADDMAMGKTEQKFLDFPAKDSAGKPVQVQLVEGQLTWETAALLKRKLEKAGASVMITRPGPGLSAFGTGFSDWRKANFQRTLDSLVKVKGRSEPGLAEVLRGKTDDRTVFRYVFRDVELRKRVQLINDFKPDYTLMIHYNVDEKNSDWQKPTEKNFNMCFVGGSYQAGELSDPERRFDFLRQLLSGDIGSSIAFSGLCAQQFTQQLGVPLARQSDATYLTTSCAGTYAQGVYARNLGLTRLTHGTLVYGETLYQDNKKECMLLMDKRPVPGYPEINTSKRVEQVAEAYYRALVEAVVGQ